MKTAVILGVAILAATPGCAGGGGALGPSAASLPALSALRGVPMRNASARIPKRPFVDSAAIAKAGDMIAVAETVDDAVTVWDPSGHLLASLDGFFGPAGMSSDIKGDLFVADSGNSRIQIYAAGLKGQPKTLSVPGEYPNGVDSFENGKVVAVANAATTTHQSGSVIVFTNGVAAQPITDPAIDQVLFDAFDATGNLYLDGAGTRGGFIAEIAHAATGGRSVALLTTANAISSPSGIQVTNAGRIAILDQGSDTVYTYDPPVGHSLGRPVATTVLGGQYASFPLAFTKDMKHLYTTNYNDDNLVLEYSYPQGGSAVSSFDSEGSYPYGVTVIPAQVP